MKFLAPALLALITATIAAIVFCAMMLLYAIARGCGYSSVGREQSKTAKHRS